MPWKEPDPKASGNVIIKQNGGEHVRKNDKIQTLVTDMTSTGEGVSKADGMTVFTEGAVPGDKITSKIVAVKPNYLKSELISIDEESEDAGRIRRSVRIRSSAADVRSSTSIIRPSSGSRKSRSETRWNGSAGSRIRL